MDQQYLDSEELRNSVRDVLTKEDAVRLARAAENPDAEKDRLWPVLSELGLSGISVPESYGGLDQRFVELSIVYEELGAGLAPATLLGTAICAEALIEAGSSEARERFLTEIAAGTCKGQLASHQTSSPVAVSRSGSDIVLNGVVQNVLGAEDAQLTLVLARYSGSEGNAYLLLESASLTQRHTPTWDQTRRIAELTLTDVRVPASLVLCEGEAAQSLSTRLASHVSLALACDAVGGARTILSRTLEYMTLRHQFGRPIGSFQALKHRCADHKTDIEAASAIVRAACEAYSTREKGWERLASAAKFRACASYKSIAEDAIQLHGGIGFTWEHDCHLFLKRARLNEMIGGTAAWQKDLIAESLRRELSGAR